MCSCHDTLPSSTLQNSGSFSSFIIYVILVLLADFFFFSSGLTQALDTEGKSQLLDQSSWTISKSSAFPDFGFWGGIFILIRSSFCFWANSNCEHLIFSQTQEKAATTKSFKISTFLRLYHQHKVPGSGWKGFGATWGSGNCPCPW